ncbi:hypothetical protein INR49_030480, partial [Caranx melampygus]
MDVSECVLSAGRAVLDMVEREWQPLSPSELEQRLDQAVEEILEADLLAKVKSQPPPTLYVQLLQSRPNVVSQVSHTAATAACSAPVEATAPAAAAAESQEQAETVDGAVVKYVTELLQSSKSRTRLAGRARLSLSHTVLLSLTLLTERVSYRSVSRRFHLEKGNIHRIFFSFCERVNMLEERIIRWPLSREGAGGRGTRCPQVLGMLGHIQIPIRLPIGKHDVESTVPEVKRMRQEAHPDSWLNLELVCDRRGRLLHCRMSRGSDVDRGIALRDKLKRHPELMPPGSCLVARAGYPLTAHILTPYTGSGGEREQLFNRTLEEHLHILDQSVTSLRARFQRLRYLDIGNYDRARAVVSTACVLHNVFLDMGHMVQGEVKTEEAITQEMEGEGDEEGVHRRDAISDLLEMAWARLLMASIFLSSRAFCWAHMFIFLSCSSMYSCRTSCGGRAGQAAGVAGGVGRMGVNLLLAMALPTLVPLSLALRWASISSMVLPRTSCMGLKNSQWTLATPSLLARSAFFLYVASMFLHLRSHSYAFT